jgi:hypothetical protein
VNCNYFLSEKNIFYQIVFTFAGKSVIIRHDKKM